MLVVFVVAIEGGFSYTGLIEISKGMQKGSCLS